MAALAGCTSFGSHSDPPPVDPNIYPADYKAIVMTFIQTDPYLLVGTQDAALSPPALQPVGTESRYFSCLRLSGPNQLAHLLVDAQRHVVRFFRVRPQLMSDVIV